MSSYIYQPVYTIKETAKLLNIGLNTVRKLIESGDLTAIRLGSHRTIRVRGTDIQRFIEMSPEVCRDPEQRG